MITSGRIEDWSVEDLLQMIRITGKTISIEVDGDSRRAVLYFRGGFLVDVDIFPDAPKSKDAKERVSEALYLVSTLRSGSFEMGTREVPEDGAQYDILELIKAIAEDKRREEVLEKIGVEQNTVLRLTEKSDGPVTLSPETWKMLAEMIPSITLAQLERSVGRRTAVGLILDIYESGVLTVDGVLAKPEPSEASKPVAFGGSNRKVGDDVEVRIDDSDDKDDDAPYETEDLDNDVAGVTGVLVNLSQRYGYSSEN